MPRKPKPKRDENPVPEGLVRIELLKPWGEREAGAVVDVDPVRAEQMIHSKRAKLVTDSEEEAEVPDADS